MCADHQDHHHAKGILGKNTELYFAVLSGLTLASGFLLAKFSSIDPNVSWALYLLSYFFGGYYVLQEAISEISKGRFEIDFLMIVAAIGAAFLGKWAEGALLLFLFSLGHALEHYAMGKARKSIAALSNLTPKIALLKKTDGFEEVAINTLRVGDTIIVKPGSKVSADGFIVKGSSSIDQSPITGESVPVDKTPVANLQVSFKNTNDIPPEHRVFSGTINGNATIEVKVTRIAADSTLNRLVTMVREAQQQKSPTQLLTDKFQKYYVPAVIILVVLLNFAFLLLDENWSDSFYRSMAVLVAASPCALAISTPSAVLSGIARAARGGVLIKGGRPLEDLGNLTALAFDKTGTLTQGQPKLTDVIALTNMSTTELLRMVVAVEKVSDHPLAKAIVRDARGQLKDLEVPIAENVKEVHGKGVIASLEGKTIRIGNPKIFEDAAPSQQLIAKLEKLEAEGKTTMLVQQGSTFIGIISLMDVPRKNAKATIAKLRRKGIKTMLMLTGDNQKVADAIAEQIGISEALGSLLPEEKVAAVKKIMAKENRLAMVGDGVNDAPAMASSSVGIAMGAAGSDVALETADVALLADKLETLPFAIGLSRKASAIIKQNLWLSLGMVALLIPATLFSWANIGVAVAFHEGSTLLVVLNALRLLAYSEKEK